MSTLSTCASALPAPETEMDESAARNIGVLTGDADEMCPVDELTKTNTYCHGNVFAAEIGPLFVHEVPLWYLSARCREVPPFIGGKEN